MLTAKTLEATVRYYEYRRFILDAHSEFFFCGSHNSTSCYAQKNWGLSWEILASTQGNIKKEKNIFGFPTASGMDSDL